MRLGQQASDRYREIARRVIPAAVKQVASVQKACGKCGRAFTTTNAAQHECEICVPMQEAA